MSRETPAPDLSLNLSRSAWLALAQAAQQLAAAASALAGDAAVCPPVAFSLSHSFTLAEAINAFLTAKAKSGRSDRYLRALRLSLRSFAVGRGNMPLAAITVDQIEEWVNREGLKARTRRGYALDLRTLFNFARKRGWVQSNAAEAVEMPRADPRPPGLHSPAQVRHVLNLARRVDLDICRNLAIRYFCGLRSAETLRLAESEIHLDRGFIEVTAAKSKTRRRRLVTVRPNLRAWLDLGGTVPLRTAGDKLREFVKATGIVWPKNVTRHSFCSYHLAHFGSAAKTALEAGHSEAILFNVYRELVSPDVAADFWSIVPVLESGQAGCPSLASGLVV